jgi:cyanophycinase
MKQGAGALALVGSGEYSPQMQEFEGELLHRAISRGKKNRFIQIPTASSHEGAASREKWQRLGREQAERIGSEWVYLPIHEREDAFNEKFVAEISGAGLIYFSGGDPHRVADVFTGSPLWEAIDSAWQSGSSLAGCSAGAMAFGGTIMGIRSSHHSVGLGIVPAIEVIPHYDKMLGWLPERVTAFLLRPDADTTLIGIDENTALVYTDKWQSYGRGKIHILRGELQISPEPFSIQ